MPRLPRFILLASLVGRPKRMAHIRLDKSPQKFNTLVGQFT